MRAWGMAACLIWIAFPDHPQSRSDTQVSFTICSNQVCLWQLNTSGFICVYFYKYISTPAIVCLFSHLLFTNNPSCWNTGPQIKWWVKKKQRFLTKKCNLCLVLPLCRNTLFYHDIQTSLHTCSSPLAAAIWSKPLFAACALPLNSLLWLHVPNNSRLRKYPVLKQRSWQ